jgi:hypothetical protein
MMSTGNLRDADMSKVVHLGWSALSLLVVCPKLAKGVPAHGKHLPRTGHKPSVEDASAYLTNLFWKSDFDKACFGLSAPGSKLSCVALPTDPKLAKES